VLKTNKRREKECTNGDQRCIGEGQKAVSLSTEGGERPNPMGWRGLEEL